MRSSGTPTRQQFCWRHLEKAHVWEQRPSAAGGGGKNTVACLCLKFWIFLSIMDSFVLIKMFFKYCIEIYFL